MAMGVSVHGILGFLRAHADTDNPFNAWFGPGREWMFAYPALLIAAGLTLILLTQLRLPSPSRGNAHGGVEIP